MRCTKCKTELDSKTLKCTNCGTRVASICKICGYINPITALECSHCHEQLLKLCPKCGSANLPTAKNCRKCGFTFKKTEEIQKPKYFSQMMSQQKIKSSLTEAIKDADTSVISLNGESGSGKSLVLRCVISDLKKSNLIWLHGTCTQITQLSPFGYFQDLLLTFFNINNFCPDTLQLKRNSLKFFKQDFPVLTNSEINDLLNLLYPESIDKYENIYENKLKTFVMLKKVIYTIIEKVKAVFIIDNFEYIDGMSYDFFKELLKDEYIFQRCKFIITSKENKPSMGLIESPHLTQENYKDFTIAPFTETQVQAMVMQYRNINLPQDFAKDAFKLSSGNPAIVEQMIMLYKDNQRNKFKYISCDSINTLINTRLNILKQEDDKAFQFLAALSILGTKFYPAILDNFNQTSPQEFERIIESLVDKGFITQLNNLAFEFKSHEIWKYIVAIIKEDECFEQTVNLLYELISIYKQSSIALLGYIIQKLNNNVQSFDVWTMLMKQCSYIGDIGLYIISQQQALKLIEYKNTQQYIKIKKNIYMRVGKLLEPINPQLSFEYLQKAIMLLDDNEEYVHIELLGYLSSVAMQLGNYWGVIECVNNVLNKIPEDMDLARALVISREVHPLVCLGNYGQAINIIDNDVIPIIQKYLSKGRDYLIIKSSSLYDIWIGIYFDLAEALTFQGDSRMFDIIKLLFDIIEKNKITDPIVNCKVRLALALSNTIKGDTATSETILDDILKGFSLDSMDAFIVSRWNFIDILNKYLKGDFNNLTNELFNVVTFANNANDLFTKNILKTILAKIFQEKNDNQRALNILEEQVSYFAKEKIATGVLLSWFLIANIRLVTKGTQAALDIAVKALDIAQSPNVNNYYFIALFNKLISEIYLAKQDFESAKVYLEKSLFIAKQFDLQGIIVSDYILYAKYYQELSLPKSSMRGEYIKQALKMFQLAKNVPIVAEHEYLIKRIKDDLSVLTSFCKLNGITLKKTIK